MRFETFEADKPFDEPWQAQIFALVVRLLEKRVISLNQWNAAVSEQLKSVNSSDSSCVINSDYYMAWTRALETLLVEQGLAGPLQLTELRSAWQLAAEKTPHGQPIQLAARLIARAQSPTNLGP